MKLPPLNALRAFEAAARNESFALAADELFVSRGAISRHVKLLEEATSLTLFRRHANGVELTKDGKALLDVVSASFASIASAVESLQATSNGLRVLCPPATATRWLIPKLADFSARHPEIPVSLTVDFHVEKPFDGIRHDVCFSLHGTPHRLPQIESLPLFPSRVSVVCSPALAETLHLPADLAQQRLIHENPYLQDLTEWARVFDVKSIENKKGEVFPNLDNAVKAAVTGQGVVVADLTLCRDELETGALVMPFPELICDGEFGDICITYASNRAGEPAIAAFIEWLVEVASHETSRLEQDFPKTFM
jgi:LysR family glycine cleavage system transcriptional activator